MPHTFRRRSSFNFERLEARRLLAIDLQSGPKLDSSSMPTEAVEESFGFAELNHHDDAHEPEFTPEALREVMAGSGQLPAGSMPRLGGPNIAVTSAHLRNGAGTAITSPVIGERVAVQVNFATLDLPAGANYKILFTVDGVTLESGVATSGANGANGNYFWWRSGWFATTGSHTVSVVVDGYGTVAENNETDNSASFSFTSVTAVFPQKLSWPIEGAPFSDVNFTNYVDLDPLSTIRDYNNGPASYDGHDAWDIGPWNFYRQDEGIDLYAAADGVVSGIYDGAFDRQTSWITPAPPANYVVIDHGSGWTTVYWHMRRDTVQVKVGDAVKSGDLLGRMGSSGISSGTHVHFGLRHFGFTVEPMLDQATYLQNPLPYVQHTVGLIDYGVTNYNPSSHIGERPSDVDTFRQATAGTVFVWAAFAGLDAGNLLEYVWRRPDGTVYLTTSSTIGQNYRGSWWWWSRNLPTNPDLGTWTVDFRVNSVVLGTAEFEVTATGAPEIRVEDSSAAMILDGRATPLAFANTAMGTSATPITVQVRNHGQSPLNILGVTLPEGFTLSDGLPSAIAAGSTDALTFTMDTSYAGYRAGRLRIYSNDADEAEYDFAIEGYVQGPIPETLTFGIGHPNLREGERTIANVRRSGSTSQSLVVNLSQIASTQLALPASVVIPAGSAWTTFFIEGATDPVFEPTDLIPVAAQAQGMYPALNEVRLENTAAVVNRRVFYNRSTSGVFGNGTGNPLNSIDSSKTALLPGRTAGFDNVTNYSRGLNGLIVDLSNDGASISAADFQFATSNGSPSSTFTELTAVPTVSVISQGGFGGSTRVKIEFDDNVLRNTWLRVTVLASPNTGLSADDVFYFGNAVGEMNVGNIGSPVVLRTNASDTGTIRQNQSPTADSVGISSLHDINKDGRVNATDTGLVRQNQTPTGSITLFTAPAALMLADEPSVTDSAFADTSWLESIDGRRRGSSNAALRAAKGA